MLRFLLAIVLVQIGPFSALNAQEQSSPNIVIILIDDAALMDIGAYGGEANTPSIDALAARGAMFLQYRTSPLCSPTRAMLLTGLDNHMTGVATIPEVLPKEHKGQPGYTMAFEPGVLTLADRLRAAGYRTLMTGKWHLGETAEEMPQNHGFDRSFALAASGADNWDDKSYMPYYQDAPWWEDGVEAALPDDFYSSEFIVDKMIEYIEATDPSKPFLAYLPFQAIHIPVQAPAEFTAKYDGVYDEGWNVLRQARYERAQVLGLITPGAALAPMPNGSRTWESLSPDERELYTSMMEVNAGMMEAMDFHIGRFVEYLKAQNRYENSIFVVTSDNGPEYNRGDDDWRITLWQAMNGYNIDPDRAGLEGSWGFIGPEWAAAAASPGALYKFYATEGGIRAPLIIAGPGISPSQVSSPAMVTDITPTLLDWVGAPDAPANAKPVTGRSLMPLLTGEATSVYGPDDVRAIEVSGNSALYKGDYKITRSMPPVGTGEWRLFNMVEDPGETVDLRAQAPEVFEDLLSAYNDYARSVGVLEMPPGYNTAEAVAENATERFYANNRSLVIALVLALVILLFGFVWSIRWILKKMTA
ncbi:MAG: arylsulfatase [Hyphomonadaceae bacterium]|nr:arylsulfatase [Hyphomonadaceae bacterium]